MNKENEKCCNNCSKNSKLDLPYQEFYCKAYNKIISKDHINDKIECEKFENNR